MKVSTRAIIETERDREAVFDFATDVANLSGIFRGAGPVAGIERAYVVGGGPTKVGAIRRLVMTDGTPLDEEVLEHERPRKFAYRLKGFRGPLRALVRVAEGQWIFSPLGVGTRISWTFTAELTSPAAAPLALPVVKVFMKRAMESCLANLRASLPAQAEARP